ncbi:MAG: hemerythrin domain-containing protein [Burkholderiaceae bacterium]|jgi:hemerythrin-like domain-containing protein|nr:hemerythrin domain-containing protein [Burkholderiaceae bacterium]
MSQINVSLPGVSTPAVGFDQPFEMLTACHERVQRSLDLLRRVRQHVAQHGHDANSRSAVGDVLRYFDIAAPLHHEDEELHLFPPLRVHPDEQVRAAVARLEDEHRQMHVAWSRLRQLLLRWRDDAAPTPPAPPDDALIDAFIALYPPHIALEEVLLYPAAQAALDAATQTRMGGEMAARRRA